MALTYASRFCIPATVRSMDAWLWEATITSALCCATCNHQQRGRTRIRCRRTHSILSVFKQQTEQLKQ
jgi:hypothetical protein